MKPIEGGGHIVKNMCRSSKNAFAKHCFITSFLCITCSQISRKKLSSSKISMPKELLCFRELSRAIFLNNLLYHIWRYSSIQRGKYWTQSAKTAIYFRLDESQYWPVDVHILSSILLSSPICEWMIWKQ